jgi:hypothetical protein
MGENKANSLRSKEEIELDRLTPIYRNYKRKSLIENPEGSLDQ